MFPSGAVDDHDTDTRAAVAVGRVVQAVDGLLAAGGEHMSGAELAEAMVALRRQQARLAAAVSDLTGAFDARRVWAEDGSRSATDWIAVRARLPRAQVAGEVRDARRVRTMPVTRAAWRAGDLSSAHVRTLTRLAGHPRAGEHFAEGEPLLIGEARRNRFDDWERLCAHWRDAADPDGPEQRRGRDRDLRRFRIGVGLDGVGHADGYLTPLAAATVTGALERIEAELFAADWAAARQIHGDDTTVAHVARSSVQRRHDALVELAERALSAPRDGQRPAPLVTVMVDYPTLAGRVCELASGTVVAPGDIAELLGRDDTLIQRVTFDGPNRLRDISAARSFRGVLRRVLEVVHRRCDHPTCFVPAHRCQGDHIVPWAHGGETSQENGRLGCGPHNRWWYTHRHRGTPPDQAPAPPDVSAPADTLTPSELSPVEARPRRVRERSCLVRDPVAGAPDLVFSGFGAGDDTITVDLTRSPIASRAEHVPRPGLAVGPTSRA